MGGNQTIEKSEKKALGMESHQAVERKWNKISWEGR